MLFPRQVSWTTLTLGWTLLALGAPAAAQTATATITANVQTVARLTLSATSVSFPDASPDLVPNVPATGGPLSITAKARASNAAQVVLTVLASGVLRSGVNTINESAITWTTTGTGFLAGTLSRTTPVAVGRWTGSGVRTGSQSLFFQNLWTYVRGTYTTSMTYTLSAP